MLKKIKKGFNQGCGTVTFFGGSDSGPGSGQNVPAPAAPVLMLKSSYEP